MNEPFISIVSTPDRDWILCDACNALLCHACCAYPQSGHLYTPTERSVLLHTSSAKAGQRFEMLAHFEEYLWQEYTRLDSGYDFATDLLERAIRPSV